MGRMITMMMRIISDTEMSIMVILRMKWYHQRMSSNMDRMRMKMIITDSVVYCNGMMMKRMICLVIRLQIIIIIIINNMMRMKMSNRMIINNKMIIHSHKRINMFLMMDRMNKIKMMTVMMDMIMDSNSNNMTIRNRLSHRNITHSKHNNKEHIIQCLKNIKVAIVMYEVLV